MRGRSCTWGTYGPEGLRSWGRPGRTEQIRSEQAPSSSPSRHRGILSIGKYTNTQYIIIVLFFISIRSFHFVHEQRSIKWNFKKLNVWYSNIKWFTMRFWHKLRMSLQIGTEFYLFVSHMVWKTEGLCVNLIHNDRNFSKFTHGSSVFHFTMRNKHCQIEFNPYIYTLKQTLFLQTFGLVAFIKQCLFLLYYHFLLEDSSELSYIYSLSKLSRIFYETSVFNMQQVGIQNSHRSRRFISHGNSFMEEWMSKFYYDVHSSRKHWKCKCSLMKLAPDTYRCQQFDCGGIQLVLAVHWQNGLSHSQNSLV